MYLLQATSWRVSWAVLGMMVLVLAVPLGLFFLRDDPAEMGLLPDGDSEVPNPSDNKKGSKNGLRGPLEVAR